MIHRIYWKRTVVTGLILLLTSSFVFFYNKHPHIDKNIINNSNNNIRTNHIYGNNTENRKIFSEINVLKETILRNNFMYNSYKKIISNNINYQKNTLCKRIKFANLSIDAEIKILNNMKNTINIHPFNYLEKFQENNYYIPEISSITHKNKFVPTSNINISNNKIKSTNPCLNSILYNSEEVFVGIKSISSVMSATRLLIFSKNNFINSNIYYFSKHLNILTTYNKYVNNNNYGDKNQLISKNKFIKKLKSKSKDIYMYSKSDLSNKNSSHNNHINKKVYISFSALLLVAGIIIVILGKVKVFNKRKSYNPVKSFTKSSSEKRELVSTDNIRTIRIFSSTRTSHLQKHIENSTHDSANSGAEPYNSIGSDNKADNPDDISDPNSSHLQNIEHMDTELTPVARNIVLPNSTLEAENNTKVASGEMLPDIKRTDNYESVLLEEVVKRRVKFHPIDHSDSQYEDPLTKSFVYEDKEENLDNDKKITLLNDWLNLRDFPHQKFYDSLMATHVKTRGINKRTFYIQVDSFLYQKKLSSLQGWRRPNSQLILSNVRTRIAQSNNQTLSDLERNEAVATLMCITAFDSREELRNKDAISTNNGWFKKPRYEIKRWLNSKNITRDEYEYIKEINKKFDNMDLLLSDCRGSKAFFKILLDEINKKTIIPEENSEMTYLDRYIVNEIILDLRQLIKVYKSQIVINHINATLLKESVQKRITFPRYIELFGNSKVIKTVYDGPRIFGTSENKIFGLLEECSPLLLQ